MVHKPDHTDLRCPTIWGSNSTLYSVPHAERGLLHRGHFMVISLLQKG